MLEHTGVVLSVAHVRPLSKISLESGKVGWFAKVFVSRR